jgi:hypothetical protein
MTQALYAHMNNKKIKIKKKDCEFPWLTKDKLFSKWLTPGGTSQFT